MSRGSTRRAVVAAGVAGSWALPAVSHLRPRLTVAAFPLLDEIIRAALPRWRALHPDVDLHVVSRQYADHHTAMTTALSTAVHLPDVMALESSYVGRFASGYGLENLAQPPYDYGAQRARIVPYAYDQAVAPDGRVVAAPTDIGPGTLLYRVDLLERAGVSVDELTFSWASFVEAGARLKARTGAYLVTSAQAVKDIVIRNGLAPGEGLYFDAQSRPRVTSPRFVRAFELAQRVRQLQLDARVSSWSNEWAEGLRRGTLACELSGAWLVGQMATWVAPKTQGLWRAAQLPQSTFVGYGGSFYAIPRRAAPERKALAWDLIRLLTLDPELQFAAFRAQDAFPALLETHESPFFRQPLPFLGGQPARLLWRDAARRITAAPLHKQNTFADEVVGTELDNVLERGKAIPDALADAQRLLERRARR